ncbi:hypothetical protein TSOC_008471 [Tetrabaena socialis]|uniref:Uncharacterized protein n=1 Tax=Tetrabaena socialis TaxID=47790 RepID=A0A2J7ZYF5_9CHLO|nr:hypothetical protein TSOC_008471 [Tetrabaena socialis]|eukprot:PNH05295.1 hypothetical protein TSOC_008471 [Tetrabaena socialis]
MENASGSSDRDSTANGMAPHDGMAPARGDGPPFRVRPHAVSEDVTSTGIGELINELQILLSEAKHGPQDLMPFAGGRWRGSMRRQASTARSSLEQVSSTEVAELQLALQQSGGALRASQLHLQALSARVEELQAQLETECESMVAQVQEELLAAHVQHERTVKALQERLRRQQAAADDAARAAAARHAALEEQLQAEHTAAGPGSCQEDLQLRLQAHERLLAELQAELLPPLVGPPSSAPPAPESGAHPLSAADMAALVQAVRGLKADLQEQRTRSPTAADAGGPELGGCMASLGAEAASLAAANSALQAELLGAGERQAGLVAEVAELREELRRVRWEQAQAPQRKDGLRQDAKAEPQLAGAGDGPQQQLPSAPPELSAPPAVPRASETRLELAAGMARLQAALADLQLAEGQQRRQAREATDLAVAALEGAAAADASRALLQSEAAQLRMQAADLGEQLGQARGRARAEVARLAEACAAMAGLRAQRAQELGADRAWWAAVQARTAAREVCGRAFRAVERAVAGEHVRCLTGRLEAAEAHARAQDAASEAAAAALADAEATAAAQAAQAATEATAAAQAAADAAAARAREHVHRLAVALTAARCELAEAGSEREELRLALARAAGELVKLQGREAHLGAGLAAEQSARSEAEAALAAERSARGEAEAAAAGLRALLAAAEAEVRERLEPALAESQQQLQASTERAAAARGALLAEARVARAAQGELRVQLAAVESASGAIEAERAALARQLACERSQHAACAARAITARALLAAERSATDSRAAALAGAACAEDRGDVAAGPHPPASAVPEAMRVTTVLWELASPMGSAQEGGWPQPTPGAAAPAAGRPPPRQPALDALVGGSGGLGAPFLPVLAAQRAAGTAAPGAAAAPAGQEPLWTKNAVWVSRPGLPGSVGSAASPLASASLSAFQGAQLEASIAALESELAASRAALSAQRPASGSGADCEGHATGTKAGKVGQEGSASVPVVGAREPGAPGKEEAAVREAEVRAVTLRVLRAVERDEAARQLHAERAAHAACSARAAAARVVYDDAHWRLSAALASYARLIGETDLLRTAHAELSAEVGNARRTSERLRLQNERLQAERAAAEQAAAQPADIAAEKRAEQAATAAASAAAEGGAWVAAAGGLGGAQAPRAHCAELEPTVEACAPAMLTPGRRLAAGPVSSAEPGIATPATRDITSVSTRGGVQALAAHEGSVSRDLLPDLGGLYVSSAVPHTLAPAAAHEAAEAVEAASVRGASVGQLQGESAGWGFERAQRQKAAEQAGQAGPQVRRRSASWTNMRLYDNPMFCGELQPEAEGGAAVRASAGSATAGAPPLVSTQPPRQAAEGTKAAEQLVPVSKSSSMMRLCRRVSRTFAQHD